MRKIILAVILAVLAAAIMGASGPEGCIAEEGAMPFTTKHRDMQIGGLYTPADGETIFRDRPTFEAGLDITAGGISIAGPDVVNGMQGRIPIAAPSFAHSIDGASGAGYGRLFSLLDSEKASDDVEKNRAVIATFEGVVSGQNAVKAIGITAVPMNMDPDPVTYPNILEIEVPQAYEGGFTGRFFLGRHADWPEHWRITLSVVMTNGAAFDYDLAYDPPDGDIDFHVMLQRQGGDGLTALWTTAMKIPN